MTKDELLLAADVMRAAAEGKKIEQVKFTGISWAIDLPRLVEIANCYRVAPGQVEAPIVCRRQIAMTCPECGVRDEIRHSCEVKESPELKPYTLETFPKSAAWVTWDDGERRAISRVSEAGLLLYGLKQGEEISWENLPKRAFKILDYAGNELAEGVSE